MFKELTEKEKDVICEVLNFIHKSPFIDDFEFQTRLGVERSELTKIANFCPNFDDEDSVIELCINNSLNEVCYGLAISGGEWSKWFSVSKEQVKDIFTKWARLKGWNSTGII